MNTRRHPLHTCGVAFLMIAHSAYTRSQEFNGPLGSITKKLSRFDKLATPIICALQYQWLIILSFYDDCILATENIIESVFPQSNHVFNEIDKLVRFSETLPGKFDDAVNRLHMVNDQVPLLDWALIHVISWLNFFITKLTHWVSEEKEIIMDSNNNECNIESSSSQSENQSTQSKGKSYPPSSPESPPTYKEALEKGSRKENEGKKDDGMTDWSPESNASKQETNKENVLEEDQIQGGEETGMDHQNQACEYMTRSDPILELFESGRLTKASKEGKGNRLTLSSSYIEI